MNDKITSIMTNMKYIGNNTSATVYKIAPVNAKPRFFMNKPNPLKSTARAVQIKCGITKAVAIPDPICSAVSAPLPAVPDQ